MQNDSIWCSLVLFSMVIIDYTADPISRSNNFKTLFWLSIIFIQTDKRDCIRNMINVRTTQAAAAAQPSIFTCQIEKLTILKGALAFSFCCSGARRGVFRKSKKYASAGIWIEQSLILITTCHISKIFKKMHENTEQFLI